MSSHLLGRLPKIQYRDRIGGGKVVKSAAMEKVWRETFLIIEDREHEDMNLVTLISCLYDTEFLGEKL